MTGELRENGDSVHWIVVPDSPHESEIPREQSREDKQYIPRERSRMSRVPRHHKWTTGRSSVTLHR